MSILERIFGDLTDLFNPYHVPTGSSKGGQFTSGKGGKTHTNVSSSDDFSGGGYERYGLHGEDIPTVAFARQKGDVTQVVTLRAVTGRKDRFIAEHGLKTGMRLVSQGDIDIDPKSRASYARASEMVSHLASHYGIQWDKTIYGEDWSFTG